ncbi:hypothetical protein CONLIGDRAFT_32009 [Coniochaeta ligniaria NRRL 30616]|uniref:Zn(2)-C6 fungal-type domain-containing protein n=1 Tax=Coniochaeta ligniaria NRRL 30616 TaxID=1408157 RepID=A0A1J7K426_9PEZI|nr:hypothetical protein CONLIGDRAFT_32009 [Coniochaeta ligniaria NRRL 30616]
MSSRIMASSIAQQRPAPLKKFATPPAKSACTACRASRLRCSGHSPCSRVRLLPSDANHFQELFSPPQVPCKEPHLRLHRKPQRPEPRCDSSSRSITLPFASPKNELRDIWSSRPRPSNTTESRLRRRPTGSRSSSTTLQR